MRIAIITLCSSFAVLASPDMPSGTAWSGEARSAAQGHVFWTDSTNWNLFDLAGHSSVLPGIGTKSLEIRVGSHGLAASDTDTKASQNEVGAIQLRGAVENKVGYRLDLGYSTQELQFTRYSPDYQSSRLRWGFDVGTAFGPDRLVGLGLGMRTRFPSSQTQDSSGLGGAPGKFERWQLGVEDLRLGMSFHFANAITLAGKFDASGDYDSMVHTTTNPAMRSMHRFAVVRLPIISLSGQVDRPEWPVQGIGDVTFGTTHRMGVMKTVGTFQPDGKLVGNANVDFPVLQGDSLRILAASMGRWGKDGHTFRPVLAFEAASLKTQVYSPVKGSKSPLDKGDVLADTGWEQSSESAILGCAYSWDRGVSGNLEFSSSKRNLDFDKGFDQKLNESHTDLGVSMGVEMSHRLVPQWKDKVPSSMEYFLRLGWERKSLAGDEIERGYLAGLTTGYEEPATGYSPAAYPDGSLVPHRGWAGQESKVGLRPSLGAGADLNLVTYGIGATFLDRALEVNASLESGSWTPDAGGELSVFGWRTELRWSL